ncbi:hypothetical protein LXT21_34480 [Myxococcus sp. K38C18041901]|uniref:hypothetical protein n=1 Tax=Myxococcus guangdongensis TaxID=2906760 RepID=UPI0020A7DA6B|nr:hypothetical protein [Myxococcus guangdongensis]MCP3063896.1 hypothetical protein [Myxococcus guangdongensis]
MRMGHWWLSCVLAVCVAGCGEAQQRVEDEVVPALTSPESVAALARAGEEAGGFRRGALVLPRGMPVLGRSITEWTEAWWHWTYVVPAERNPELVLDADCGVAQSGPVYFVPAYDGATTYRRTCRVPFGKPVLVPLWIIINDFPCPDPDFKPAPGQTLEQFLRAGARDFNDLIQGVDVTVNGRPVPYTAHRHTGSMFTFSAHPSLVGKFPDPCLTGTPQQGVSDGWWLMLVLAPGTHTVHVTALSPMGSFIDYTYRLEVGW